MALPPHVNYVDAKARVVRTTNRITTFLQASVDYINYRSNNGKRAKISKLLGELNSIRQIVEDDIQQMETAVEQKTAPVDVTDNRASQNLVTAFDNIYYELATFADVHNLSLHLLIDNSANMTVMGNQSSVTSSLLSIQLQKRKFPTFSGALTEWHGFEDLFKSILSHAPELPDELELPT